MKKIQFYAVVLVLVLLSAAVQAQQPKWQWAKTTGDTLQSYAYAAATDADGNVYLAAGFNGDRIHIGDSTFFNRTGSVSALLLKYSATGDIIWARNAQGYNTAPFNGNINADPSGLSIDRDGNVYICGGFQGSMIVFADGDTLFNMNPIQYGTFLVKYDRNGQVLWARTADAIEGIHASGVSTDAAGNAYVTGFFNEGARFGNTNLYTVHNGSSAFIAKYDSAGNVQWATTTSRQTALLVQPFGIAADSTGNVFVSGYFQFDSVTFGSVTAYNPSPYGSDNAFTVKFNTDGQALWIHAPTGGNMTNTHANSVSIDDAGNSYITGKFTGAYIIFGDDTLTGADLNDNIFIVKYNEAGKVVWAKTAKSSNGGQFKGVCIRSDAAGKVTVLGTNFNSSDLILGGDTISLGAEPHTANFFVAKLDTAGNAIWLNGAGINRELPFGPTVTTLAQDKQGAVYVAGYLTPGNIELGDITITSPPAVLSYFIAKLDTTGSVTSVPAAPMATSGAIVFPNPSQGLIKINNIPANTQLTITDALGRQLLTQEINTQGTVQVNLSKEPGGLYFFRFTTASGSITSKVILEK